jgi:hypothetical protein
LNLMAARRAVQVALFRAVRTRRPQRTGHHIQCILATAEELHVGGGLAVDEDLIETG